jgi:DNA-binding IclR family transcriptional regulator
MPDERILIERTRPLVKDLTEHVKETIHDATRIGHEIVYVTKIEPSRSLRMASRLGETAPIHSTALGKAILAFSDDDLLHAVISADLPRITEATITDPELFIQEIHEVRSLGYEIDNMENEPNVR